MSSKSITTYPYSGGRVFSISSFEFVIASFMCGGKLSSSSGLLVMQLDDIKDSNSCYKQILVYCIHRLQCQKHPWANFITKSLLQNLSLFHLTFHPTLNGKDPIPSMWIISGSHDWSKSNGKVSTMIPPCTTPIHSSPLISIKNPLWIH